MPGAQAALPVALLGLNFRAAPVEVRERLACGPERTPVVLHELLGGQTPGQGAIREAVLLSTCNRTELYVLYADLPNALKQMRELFERQAAMPVKTLESLEYSVQGEPAVKHVLRVATGLDSLVIGENEILGQVRRAHDIAHAAGADGPILAALFRAAIQAGKRARTETRIGSEGLSVASVVVELAEQKIGPLSERTALLIGAGKISSMTARALAGAGLRWTLIANRTFERAKKLAGSLNGRAVHFNALEQSLVQADIVICSTGAPHLVLHAETIFKAQQTRGGRPLLVADLAVPRDVDPAIAGIPGVQLVDIDDLEEIMKTKHMPAGSVCAQVESIVQEEQEAFARWYAARRCAPVIQALQHKAEQVYRAEAEHALGRLGPLTPQQEQVVRAMAKAIAGKMLHDPVTRLQELSQGEDACAYLDLAQNLYRLP